MMCWDLLFSTVVDVLVHVLGSTWYCRRMMILYVVICPMCGSLQYDVSAPVEVPHEADASLKALPVELSTGIYRSFDERWNSNEIKYTSKYHDVFGSTLYHVTQWFGGDPVIRYS